MPMPSPTKRMTPRATPVGGVVPLTLERAAALIRASIARVADSYQTRLSATDKYRVCSRINKSYQKLKIKRCHALGFDSLERSIVRILTKSFHFSDCASKLQFYSKIGSDKRFEHFVRNQTVFDWIKRKKKSFQLAVSQGLDRKL